MLFEDNIASMSANERNTLESVLPIQLPDSEMDAFVEAFHGKAKGGYNAARIYPILERATMWSGFVNSVFAALRATFRYAEHNQVNGATLASVFNDRVKGYVEAIMGESSRAKTVVDYLNRIRAVPSRVIVPSKKYRGGYDIEFVGTPGNTNNPLISEAFNSDFVPSASKSMASNFEGEAAKYADAILKCAEQLQRLLLDESVGTLASSYKRIYQQHDMTVDFWQEINKIVVAAFKSMGVNVTLPVIQVPELGDAVKYKASFSYVVVREADPVAVTRKRSNPDAADDLMDFNVHKLILAPNIGFSIALNLTKPQAQYVSQSEQPKLAALNIWSAVWSAAALRPKGAKTEGGALRVHRIPRYVFMPSLSGEITKRRKELGLYVEPGRTNEDALYISDNGDLHSLPSTDAHSNENAVKYEAAMEEALKASFSAGAPFSLDNVGAPSPVFELNTEYSNSIRDLKKKVSEFGGSIQAYNWDLNTIISVSQEGDSITGRKIVGAARPDELNLATYMRLPFGKAMTRMFSRARDVNTKGSVVADSFAGLGNSVFIYFMRLYSSLVASGKVLKPSELIAAAAKQLGIASLNEESVKDFELGYSGRVIYSDLGVNVGVDLSLDPMHDQPERVQFFLEVMYKAAAKNAFATNGTLARWCAKNDEEPVEQSRYFDPINSTAGEYSNLYNWLGGRVWYLAMKSVLSIPLKTLLQPLPRTGDYANVSANSILTEVYPMCVMLGKYIPEKRDEIYKKADEISLNNKEPKVGEHAIRLPGSAVPNDKGEGGLKLFPHQAEAAAVLHNHPRYAFLDIAPGGGKTLLGILDIGMLYHDNLIKKPFVLCPSNLIKNWVEDLHKFTAGNWNAIPIDSHVYREWGDERLTKLIQSAPRNTIVIVGMDFMSKTTKTQLVLGTLVELVSNALEFVKKFAPDYLIIDEGHRVRRSSSYLHKYSKTISTMSSVKYVRMATGTMVQNVLADVVGECAIFNGQIFRTRDEFEAENMGVIGEVNGKPVIDYYQDTPMKIRSHMAENITIMSYKRKEWAFMLPTPIEKFISVSLENQSGADDPLGRAHRMMYTGVLKETLEELKQSKLLKSLLASNSDEDEDEEGNSDKKSSNTTTTASSGHKIDVSDDDEDEEDIDALETALRPRVQMLEQLLLDPFGDPDLAEVAKAHFGPGVDRDSFVSAKTRKVLERIKLHFTPNEWSKGKTVTTGEVYDYAGQSYIYKPDERYGQAEVSSTPPDVDTKSWKPQSRGKILIVCRYQRSVEAIYRALPAEYKKMAVRYHGNLPGADDNLDKFKSDNKTYILVTTEDSISEGHNMQACSRFIRVESPWAPGELDQTMSRLFRPDAEGKFVRNNIFLDWILCDGTLEVCKMGRLISKMLRKAQFDELHNPKYYKGLNPRNLPLIRMSLDNLRELDSLSDLCSIGGEGDAGSIHGHSYIGQYQFMVSEQAAEFKEMRETKRAYLIPVEPTPMPKDASIIDCVPWLPNMRVPDRNGEGLVALNTLLEDDEHPLAKQAAKDKDALVGQIVRTEFGIGTIASVKASRKRKGSVEDDEDSHSGISKVVVELQQGGKVSISSTKVYLALKLTEKEMAKHNRNAPKITDDDRKRTEQYAKQEEETIKRQEDKPKPPRPGSSQPKVPKVAEVKTVELHPVVYNGFLAVEAITENPDDKYLKEFGFVKFDDYAFLVIKNYKQFTEVLEYLGKKFTLAPKTIRMLDRLHGSFVSGRGRKFDVELFPAAEFPMFYKLRHQITKVTNPRKPELKLYPMVVNGTLILNVDISTNPVIVKHIGKQIAVGAKFERADGLDLIFPKSKRDIAAKVKEMRQSGKINVINLEDFKEEVAALDLKLVTS